MSFLKSKSLIKIALTCILLGTIPSVVVGAFSYHSAAQIIQRKVSDGCVSQLQQVQMSVENQLVSVRKTLLQFVASPSITQSVNANRSGTEFEAFNRMEDEISSLPSGGIDIYNVSLVNAQKKWALDKYMIYDLNDYETLNPAVSSYLKSSDNFLWDDHAVIRNASNQSVVSCVSAVQKYTCADGGVFIGKIDLPYSGFSKLIHANSSVGKTIILGKNGDMIYSDCMDSKNLEELSSQLQTLIHDNSKSTGRTEAATQQGRWEISYIHSSYNGWYYFLVTPMSEITRESNTILNFTFSVCCLLILVIITASIIISRVAYQPIQRIDKALTKGDIAPNPAAKGEIQQIEERVSRLISDHSDMKLKISAQAQKLKEYFVMKLLTTQNSYDLLKNRISLYGLPDPPPPVAILLIQPNLVNQKQYKESDLDIILYGIGNIVTEMFADHSIALSAIVNNRQVTILSVEGDYQERAMAAANQIQLFLRTQLELEVSIIISRAVNGYGEIHKRYNECIDTLYYRFLEDKSVFFVDDEKSENNQNAVYPKELEDEIIESVKTCDRAKCSEMIHQFVTSIFDIQSNRCVYKIYLMRLVVSLIIVHTQTSAQSCQNDSEYIRQLYGLHGKEEVEQWLVKTVAESVMQQIERSADSHLKEICDSVLHIIHSEYATKLTLESCAEKLNYHPSYIRRILKKQMGINFREYLLQYRINIAKKWMLETEMSIAEIARKLQYENTENFVRSFKKLVGCTPKQYRDQKNTL